MTLPDLSLCLELLNWFGEPLKDISDRRSHCSDMTLYVGNYYVA